MNKKTIKLSNCKFEILTDDDIYKGIGIIEINDIQIRSGRLPLLPNTNTFSGLVMGDLYLLKIEEKKTGIKIKTKVNFHSMPIKNMRDHSFDPIHDTTDWDERQIMGTGMLDININLKSEDYFGYSFNGFSYHYEYRSDNVPLYYLYDRASWEITGDINGAAVYNQSACSPPVIKFSSSSEWSTEGRLYWLDEKPDINSVMTHNLPRWASHQCFDYQFKNDITLIGVFDRVDLIRSVIKKEKNRSELKVFDKHIFTETLSYSTTPKNILLNTGKKSETDQKNLWTWLIQELHDRARKEYGLKEELPMPRIGFNFWENFTVDSYYIDLLPAAVNTGIQSIFIDNLFKSDMSEGKLWNMCCGHEFEPAPSLAGSTGHKKFFEECRKLGITPYSWTNNAQSLVSPLNASERDEERDWYVKMEDTRIKYGGAYTACSSVMKLANPETSQYFIDTKMKIKNDTGINAYLFDSFYNCGFMPVDYTGCKPKTVWREVLAVIKTLQDADIHFMIESFGPFGEVQHGCPKEYNLENLFICYKIMLGTGYTTIPSGNDEPRSEPYPANDLYKIIANMAKPSHNLFYGDKRIDELFSCKHKSVIKDYYKCLPYMQKRILQEDNESVLWQCNKNNTVIWNFKDRTIFLPGVVTDVTNDKVLFNSNKYHLKEGNTYLVSEAITSMDLIK